MHRVQLNQEGPSSPDTIPFLVQLIFSTNDNSTPTRRSIVGDVMCLFLTKTAKNKHDHLKLTLSDQLVRCEEFKSLPSPNQSVFHIHQSPQYSIFSTTLLTHLSQRKSHGN